MSSEFLSSILATREMEFCTGGVRKVYCYFLDKVPATEHAPLIGNGSMKFRRSSAAVARLNEVSTTERRCFFWMTYALNEYVATKLRRSVATADDVHGLHMNVEIIVASWATAGTEHKLAGDRPVKIYANIC